MNTAHQIGQHTKDQHRLSDALCGPARTPIVTLPPLSCNISAIEACRDFALGRDYLVALVGPSGWGKSLMLRSLTNWMTNEYGYPIRVQNSIDLLRSGPKAESLGPLIIEDIQDAVRQPRRKHELKALLEKRIRLRRPTLVSLTAFDGHLSLISAVPHPDQWTLGLVQEPAFDEKKVIIAEMAKLEGAILHSGLVSLLARHLYGNGCSIAGALHCLTLIKHDWSHNEDVASACGTISPFLNLHNWDPYGEIIDAVTKVHNSNPKTDLAIQEVSCYLMVTLANFGEEVVAQQLRLEPHQVYNITNKISKIQSNFEYSQFIESCRVEIIKAFSNA